MSNQYAKRDHRALGEHYLRHVSAMTGEGLHAKSDIAAELAWRDAEIERLRSALRGLHDDIVEYQRINHLGGYDNHWMLAARAALAATESKP